MENQDIDRVNSLLDRIWDHTPRGADPAGVDPERITQAARIIRDAISELRELVNGYRED